jgi:hypothetical protein
MGLAVFAGAILLANSAEALINPRFTPKDLIAQAETVLVVKAGKADAQERVPVQLVKVLKGKSAKQKFVIDLAASGQKEWTTGVKKDLAAMGEEPMILFAGKIAEEADQPKAAGFIHVNGDWNMIGVDTPMKGTWEGGTDMLIRCAEYLIGDPDGNVPTAVGCQWADGEFRRKLGKVAGPVRLMRAVDLASDGHLVLFVAAESGDRLYGWETKKKDFQDVTAQRGLASRSQAAVWADFTGKGKADLVSWDGKALTLWAQTADGRFPSQGVAVAVELKDGCLGLDALDTGVVGRPGVLVSTKSAPLLLRPAKGGGFASAAALDLAGADLAALGAVRKCLVADLDGDGFADVLQLGEKGSLIYAGKGAGVFAPAEKCAISTGKGVTGACVADLAMDGKLGVFTVGEQGCRLWWNRGNFEFLDTFEHSGEMSYTAGPGGVDCAVCDINGDGRQDMAVFFSAAIPQIFFNRGFRSFGKSLKFTDEAVGEIKDLSGGQQAGVVEDFTGGGAQDMALAAKDGTIYVFLRKVFDDEPPLCVRAVLSADGPSGPVTVTGWDGNRCLGAWSVSAGSPGAVLARADAGPIKLTWQFPGGKRQEKSVTVVDGPVKFQLRP